MPSEVSLEQYLSVCLQVGTLFVCVSLFFFSSIQTATVWEFDTNSVIRGLRTSMKISLLLLPVLPFVPVVGWAALLLHKGSFIARFCGRWLDGNNPLNRRFPGASALEAIEKLLSTSKEEEELLDGMEVEAFFEPSKPSMATVALQGINALARPGALRHMRKERSLHTAGGRIVPKERSGDNKVAVQFGPADSALQQRPADSALQQVVEKGWVSKAIVVQEMLGNSHQEQEPAGEAGRTHAAAAPPATTMHVRSRVIMWKGELDVFLLANLKPSGNFDLYMRETIGIFSSSFSVTRRTLAAGVVVLAYLVLFALCTCLEPALVDVASARLALTDLLQVLRVTLLPLYLCVLPLALAVSVNDTVRQLDPKFSLGKFDYLPSWHDVQHFESQLSLEGRDSIWLLVQLCAVGAQTLCVVGLMRSSHSGARQWMRLGKKRWRSWRS